MLKTVKLYSRVKISRGKNEKCFILVNPNEVNVSKGRISFESPLGKALLNRKTEEEISVKAPKGVVKYEITAID